MAIDSRYYIHPADKAALKALKAIPGFDQVLKAFMSVWNEKLFRIANMSSNLRVGETQLKKYYDMLIPICEKLGIEVPELYVELDVSPNAYTYGDTKPFIVITSGLLERFPDELIQTVIAHECGHIACHHTLYTTMGQLLLNGAFFFSNESIIITAPLKMAFAYWMRCSEFSADRAALICDGSAEKITHMCMFFSGYNPSFSEEADVDAFMEQAKEYKELTKNSKVSKAMEFIQFWDMDHPLNAVRAYDAVEWSNSEDYQIIVGYLSCEGEYPDDAVIPVPCASKRLIGLDYKDVIGLFEEAGFKNISAFDEVSKAKHKKKGVVIEISIDGNNSFKEDEWFKSDALISIRYKA